ncbi:MAG: haloacid dehalogenase type II [Methylobacterium frigidaeris]
MSCRPRVVAFDVIGTTFSLEPVRAGLVALGLPALALELLYAATLRDMFALAASGRFAPFMTAMGGCLDELFALSGTSASPEQKRDVLAAMRSLPPHEDAGEAFAVLRGAGIRVVALSNGAAASTRGLLDAAGLAGLVEQVFSVEEVGLSKPRPEVYHHAVGAAGVQPHEMALVATHPWDVHGARAAGLIGAYVARGRPYPDALMSPDVSGESLLDVSRRIAAR